MPIHVRAEPGDYAPTVILPGDPIRATKIAARFDEIVAFAEIEQFIDDHHYTDGFAFLSPGADGASTDVSVFIAPVFGAAG